jgi:hypothetical protein
MLHMELHLTRVYWFTNGTQFTHNYWNYQKSNLSSW